MLIAGVALLGAAGGATALMRSRRTLEVPPTLNLATGPKGAVYVEVGSDVAKAIEALVPTTHVNVMMTGATVDNLRLLTAGRADLAFASLDGAVVDPRVRDRSIMAISRMYDSFLHLVVPAESKIRTLRDVQGVRVSVGASGSGTEFTSTRLLASGGIEPSAVVRLGQAAAMDSLDKGTTDAAFSLTGFPTPAITALAKRRSLRLIPLGEYFGMLDRAIPRVYGPAAIPDGTYVGVAAADTVFVPNVLLARPKLSDDIVTVVTEAVLSTASRRFWAHPDSQRVDSRMAIATGPVHMHPAAQAWLNGNKP